MRTMRKPENEIYPGRMSPTKSNFYVDELNIW